MRVASIKDGEVTVQTTFITISTATVTWVYVTAFIATWTYEVTITAITAVVTISASAITWVYVTAFVAAWANEIAITAIATIYAIAASAVAFICITAVKTFITTWAFVTFYATAPAPHGVYCYIRFADGYTGYSCWQGICCKDLIRCS